jgi:WD40 repeat protein
LRFLCGILIVCLISLESLGQPDIPVRKDTHGDPLPSAATVRLGTHRLWHGATLSSVALSPDGKIVASGSNIKVRLLGPNHTLSSGGSEIRLWDSADGKLIRKLTVPNFGSTNCLAFSPDGKLLAIGSSNNLSLWNVATGQQAGKLEKAIGNFAGIGFSDDGKLLHATRLTPQGQPGGTVEACRWDAASGKILKTWTDTIKDKAAAPAGEVVQISLWVSPDGQTLVKGYWKAPAQDTYELRLFDADSGKQLGVYTGLTADPNSLVFSADGKRFAVGQGPSTYVGSSNGKAGLIKIAERAGAISLSPDGKALICLESKQMSHWDADTGKQVRRLDPLDQSRFPWIKSPLATNGKILATGDGEVVRLWNLDTGKELLPHTGHHGPVQHVSYSRDGRSLFSSDGQNGWRWDLATGKGDRLSAKEMADRPGGARGRLSSDGRAWIQPGGGGLIEVASGKRLGGVPVLDSWSKPDVNVAAGLVAWMQMDGRIRVNNLKGELVREFGHSGPTIPTWIWSHILCFSPDGRLLLSSFAYGQRGQAAPRNFISVWDVATGREVRRLPITRPDGSPVHLASAAFSSDGRMLVVGQYVENLLGMKGEPAVSVWDVMAGQECRKFGNHEGAVLSVAFAPDDRSVASGSDDGTILCWNLIDDSVKQPAEINADRLQALWKDLGGDAPRALDAYWLLSAQPKQVVPFLKENLRPVPPSPQEPIEKLIDDLGKENFVVRERAMKALEKLGDKAVPALTRTLAKKPSPELRRRAEALLAQAESQLQAPPKDALQPLRALAVLERMRTPEAIELLRKLADGAEEARLTQEAKAILARITSR